jgi:ABC-type phosphate transport system substrate-binding protein
MTKRALASLVLLAATLGIVAPAGAGPFRVVVNSANPASGMARADVARLFLKKANAWPSGQAAQPVDQSKDSAVRRSFSQAVLGKDVAAVESYWQQAIFSGRAVPPVEKASDADVLALVRQNPNAIGYVSAGAELGPSVKELTVR